MNPKRHSTAPSNANLKFRPRVIAITREPARSPTLPENRGLLIQDCPRYEFAQIQGPRSEQSCPANSRDIAFESVDSARRSPREFTKSMVSCIAL